ncbi:MAG: glutamate--tRNA ligase [Nanoarchaeota archaeon]|nr:glutamate--tRNA ligase [Nanoarchaeota archaeon]MBU1051314.1 glutamate--tRNA ligase [Nanoarchaeota archaeon]MBU1988458.1 glutamate--tRNA ligase [Nanoarchaeota archaeon]
MVANLSKEMKAYALRNALEHGQAVVGKVLPKLFNHGLEKSEIKGVMKDLNEVIRDVNSLSKEEREEMYEKYKKFIKKREVVKKDLPELAVEKEKKVVMRFKPSPSGPLHIGHAYTLGLNHLFVKKYGRELILWIDDTNPDNIYEKAYDLIPKDADWLTSKGVSKVLVQSDQMKKYYEYFEKLLEMGKVYVCSCDPEAYKKLINAKKACPCRGLGVEDQRERWKKMFKRYKMGEVVARLKTDLMDKNPAMRDFPLMRINESKHARQGKKYRVWPLMNFAVAIDDIETGATHVIRGKDHADNAKRQARIHEYLGWKTPKTLFHGRINFLDMPVSSTQMRKEIEAKKYYGWDDIRLPTLLALKRRGYQPEALLKYALEVGISLTDKKVGKEDFFKAINAFNREVIDAKANRYFFVNGSNKVRIKGAGKKEVKIPLHPDAHKRGMRKLKTGDEFYIVDKLEKGKNYRLMHLFNFKDKEFVSEEIDESLNAKMIHWLPVSKKLTKVKVLMEDGKEIKGFGERDLKNVKVGEIVQFERFGFVRLDSVKKGGMEFWWLHK